MAAAVGGVIADVVSPDGVDEAGDAPTIQKATFLRAFTMHRPASDQEKLIQIASACQEAILAQRERESRQGFGLDDYTEGRIVGAASLARKIMRALSGGELDASILRARSRKHLSH